MLLYFCFLQSIRVFPKIIYRYQVPTLISDTLLSNFTYGDLTLGFDWKLIYTKISVGALISDENQTFLQIRNSRYFQIHEFIWKKSIISFDPYINLLMGTRYKVESTTESYPAISPTNRKSGSGMQSITNTSRTSGTITATNTTYSRDFGLMEIDFGLPVTFSFSFRLKNGTS
jgi:hypothetical protein